MRKPISRARCTTIYESSPYNPIAARTRAIPRKASQKKCLKPRLRGGFRNVVFQGRDLIDRHALIYLVYSRVNRILNEQRITASANHEIGISDYRLPVALQPPYLCQ
jgi:hypothetical protein